uniref:Uncharacterized protein n=1 Tax=Panagrolaimus sp. ES5 TaxID=591445 RepID=A0AC34FCL3_9BILA
MAQDGNQLRLTFNPIIIDAYVNGQDFARFEEHDIEHLKDLYQKNDVSKSDKKLIKKAIQKSETAENGILQYDYKKDTPYGKYSAASSLLGLSKILKNDVYVKYESLYIVNVKYSIINAIAELYNRNLPRINDLFTNYVTHLNNYKTIWGSEKQAKHNFSRLVDSPEHKNTDDPFIQSLVNELQIVQKSFQTPSNLNHKQIIGIYTTFIMDCVYQYLVQNEFIRDRHCSLGNNGIFFKPLKPFDKQTEIPKIENYVFERTNLNIHFS